MKFAVATGCYSSSKCFPTISARQLVSLANKMLDLRLSNSRAEVAL